MADVQASLEIVTRGGAGDVLRADTWESADISLPLEATQHPVEDGSTLTDHIIQRPREWSIRALFTPTPLRADVLPPAGVDRPLKVVSALTEAWAQRQPVVLTIDGATYANCVILQCQIHRELADGASRTVTLQVRQLLISQVRRVPGLRQSSRPKASLRRVAKTTVQTVEITPATAAQTAATLALSGKWEASVAVAGVAVATP